MKLNAKTDLVIKALLTLYCGFVFLSACTSDEEQVEEAATEEGAEATAEAKEGQEATGEEVSTDDTEDTMAGESEPQAVEEDLAGAQAESDEMMADQTASDAQATESSEYNAAPQAAQAVPAAVGSEVDTMSQPVENESVEAASGRVVRFVRRNSLTAHQSPSTSAPTADTYHRGDVVLVTYQGAWARLDDGSFVEAKALSTKGVGRKRVAALWRSQK